MAGGEINFSCATCHDSSEVCCHGKGYILDINHSLLVRKAISASLFLRFQNQLVKGVKTACEHASPVGGRIGLQVRGFLVCEPSAIEHACTFFVAVGEIFFGLAACQGFFFDGVVQISFICGCIEKAYSRKAHFVMVCGAATICRRVCEFFLGFAVIVESLCYSQAFFGKGGIVFIPDFGDDGQACGKVSGCRTSKFCVASGVVIASQDSSCRTASIMECVVLVFRRTPPSVVFADIANRNWHCRNNALGCVVSLDDIFGAKLGFSENVWNVVCILRFALVEGVVVLIAVLVGCCGHGQLCYAVGNRLAFFKVVSAVVPTAGHIDIGKRAVFQVTRRMEPGFRITATVDSIELEYRIAEHGVNSVADDKGGGIIVSDLDAQSFVFGKTVREKTSF